MRFSSMDSYTTLSRKRIFEHEIFHTGPGLLSKMYSTADKLIKPLASIQILLLL